MPKNAVVMVCDEMRSIDLIVSNEFHSDWSTLCKSQIGTHPGVHANTQHATPLVIVSLGRLGLALDLNITQLAFSSRAAHR